MTIHFFTFSDRVAPSSRQRAFYIAEELEKRRFLTVMHMPTVLSLSRTPWPEKWHLIFELLRSLSSIEKDDIVFLQRTVYNKYFFIIMVAYLLVSRRKMIFDFDDPIYVHTPFKTKILSKMANAVITCTHEQARWAKQFNTNVHTMHIAIDPRPYEKHTIDHRHNAARPTIGWLGTGPEHIANFSVLVPVLTKLAASNIAFTFTLIGAFEDQRVYSLFRNIPNLDVRFIDRLVYTDPESAPTEIQKFDIGVVPHLSEGAWYKGKTSMKILEYMACAVPVVVSNFGEMPYIIDNGENGYLASTEEEWVQKLTLLLTDSELRKRLGRAGQKTVQDRYSFDAILPQMVQLIQSL